ncbi:MFS transporter [Tautonia plasticadhaerens]|uniref:Inner membrane transport protein YnfM n=1 Tax=Tautonia plasticadhaerens TaxID=2527974 RepID=A0A518H194_9BACT|nr:MFS transporter [Tautonia plasticadhaerens]QDV34617.1 Inner membrane transport protein YnfM [Tautonia plasticadhaerens]
MIGRRTLWAMAVGCGLSVANLYYAQPLLADMAADLGVSDRRMGTVAMLSQVGYAAGMLLFVPLGDRLERRSFILTTLGAVTVALLGVAAAPGYPWLAAASLAVGVTTIAPQLLIPFAAHLAGPGERGRVVGTVMSGLLIGILAARTVSGVVGEHLGWRAMYALAAALMVALALALRVLLPRSQPEHSGMGYLGLLRSIGGLLREEPALRQSCLFGAMGFGAFSAFWTTLAFHLTGPPFGYEAGAVGLFGLVGVAGALAAPLAGRLADRRSPRSTIGAGLSLVLVSFLIFAGLGRTLWGLVAGVVLMDLGAQSAHISNQSRIFAVRPEARSRMNTAYMVAAFAGGALGSYGGAWGWGLAGWRGVCVVGLAMTTAGLIAFAATSARRRAPAVTVGGDA